MNGVKSNYYKGIEFIRIEDMPDDTSKKFLNSTGSKKVITILTDEELLKDCVLLKDTEEYMSIDRKG